MTYCKTQPKTISTSNFYIEVKKARLKAKHKRKFNLLQVNKYRINSLSHQFEIIVDTVCYHLNVNVDDVFGKSRKRHIVEARQISAYICRNNFNMSLPYIGKKLNRNHATIIHSVQTVSDLMVYESNYCKKVVYLQKECKVKLNV